MWAKSTSHPHLFYSTILVPLFKKANVDVKWHYTDGTRDYMDVQYFLKHKMFKPLRDEDDEDYVYIFR